MDGQLTQIINSAIITLSPKSLSDQRQLASNTLESLSSTTTPTTALDVYINLLHVLFFTDAIGHCIKSSNNTNNVSSTGVTLLFLSMLHNQCRRMESKSKNCENELVLRNLLDKVYLCLNNCNDTSIQSHLCSVTAAGKFYLMVNVVNVSISNLI